MPHSNLLLFERYCRTEEFSVSDGCCKSQDCRYLLGAITVGGHLRWQAAVFSLAPYH